MLYCTKCDREYTDDQTLCPECGSVLVQKASDDDAENRIPVACESEENASRIEAFFRYSGLEPVFLEYEDSTDSYKVLVNESDYPTAVKLLKTFNAEEKKRLFEQEQNEEKAREEAAAERLLFRNDGKVFVKSSDKYQDVRSSAFSLILIGSVLLICEALDLLNIIHLNLNVVSEILMQVIFVGLGLGFLIGGLLSLRRAASLKKDIREEDELTDEVLEWFLHTYTASDLDNDIDEACADGEKPEETERELRRLELIKSYINAEYDIPDDSFVDALSETIYQKIYESRD